MPLLFKERGFISIKVLFWLAFLGYLVYCVIMVVPLYINAEFMKDEMALKARIAQTLKDEEILAGLARKAKELGLPLAADKFVITRDEEKHSIRISTKGGWDVQVQFLMNILPQYTTKTFHFEPVIDETYSTRL